MDDPRHLGIGALSRRSGCSIDTIRYYERIRLLPPVPRSEGGHRLYTGTHVRRLAFIRRGRRLGFSLQQVGELLHGLERDACSCRSAKTLLRGRLAAVRSRLRELQDLERNLCAMLDECGSAELANCRVIEALAGGEAAPHPQEAIQRARHEVAPNAEP